MPSVPAIVEDLTAFGRWLARHGINYAAAGRALGRSRTMVHLLATGKADPGLNLVGRIERWTALLDPKDVIRPSDWSSYVRETNR